MGWHAGELFSKVEEQNTDVITLNKNVMIYKPNLLCTLPDTPKIQSDRIKNIPFQLLKCISKIMF